MNILVVIIAIVLVIFNFYLGHLQAQLFGQKIYNTLWRFSFKTLNKAINETNDNDAKMILENVKKKYLIYLSLWIIEIALILLLVFKSNL